MRSRIAIIRLVLAAAAIVALLMAPLAVAGDPRFSGQDAIRDRGEGAWHAQNARWQKARAGSKAAASRRNSRTAHASLAAPDAVALGRKTFPAFLTGDRGDPAGLSSGVRVAEHLDEFTARLETATGVPMGVLASTRPLSTETAGERSSVDLDLRSVTGGYAAERPAAPFTLPAIASGEVSWPQARIGLRVGAPSAGDEPTLRDDHLYYTGAAGEAADYILSPVASGVEVKWLIRGAVAPEDYRMSFDLPAGASLRGVAAPGGMRLIGAQVVGAGGEVLQTVTAPIAVDADGTPVQAIASVEGSDLVVSVDHRERDLKYPLLVDPVVETWTVGGTIQNCGSGGTGGQWAFFQNSSTTPYWQACSKNGIHGLYAGQTDGGWYNQSSTAYWTWKPRSDSYVQSINWLGSRHVTAYDMYNLSDYTRFYAGIWAPKCPCWRAYSVWGNSSHLTFTQNINATHDADNAEADFGIYLNRETGNYWDGGYVGMDGVSLTLNDNYAPHNVAMLSFEPGLQASTIGSAYRESPWMNMVVAPPRLSAQGQDRGLGLKLITLNDYLDRWVLWTGYTSGCTGLKNWNCTNSLVTTTQTSAATAYRLPQGITEARVRVADVTGKPTYATPINLKNDTSVPIVRFSEELALIAGQTAQARSYQLGVEAEDGLANGVRADARSGTVKMQVFVDGYLEATIYDQVCGPAGNCSPKRNWTFDPLKYPAGRHTIRADAWDALGHKGTNSLQVTTAGGVLDDSRPDEPGVDGEPSSVPYSAEEVDDENEPVTCQPDPEISGDIECSDSSVTSAMAEPSLTSGQSYELSLAASQPRSDGTLSYMARRTNEALQANGDGWGFADQDHGVFDEPGFPELGLKRVRLLVPWDLYKRTHDQEYYCPNDKNGPWIKVPANTGPEGDPAKVELWVNTAIAKGYEVMVTINRSSHGPAYCRLPSLDDYEAWVGEIMRKLENVGVWGSWNEPNDYGQPTSLVKNGALGPKRAAQYYRVLGKVCRYFGRNPCKRVSGEFADKDTVFRKATDAGKRAPCTPPNPKPADWKPAADCKSYFARYAAAIKGAYPRYWGWHAYAAGTDRSSARLREYLRRVTKFGVAGVEFWLTENGGRTHVKDTGTESTGGLQGPDKPTLGTDALGDMEYILSLPAIDDRITRFYYYEWAGAYPKEDPSNPGKPPLHDTGLTDFTRASSPLNRWDGNRDGPKREMYCVYLRKTNPDHASAPTCKGDPITTNPNYVPVRATG